MFFYLSKLLTFLFSPVVWVVALLLYSFFSKTEKRAKKSRIIGLVILYLCTNSFLVDELFRAYETVTPDYDFMDTRYKAAVVLGGIGEVDVRLKKINFKTSADRLFQTLRLYKLKRIEKIIFTGGSGSIEFPEKKEGLYVYKYLREIGIPDSALIIEKTSRNTYENAVFTKQLLDSSMMKEPLLLVTSAYHMPRALAVFKKAGYENLTPYVTDRYSGIRRYTFDHLFIPNPNALFQLQFLIHEWIGFVVYKIKGYA